jgi:hypothetical protein
LGKIEEEEVKDIQDRSKFHMLKRSRESNLSSLGKMKEEDLMEKKRERA